MKTTKQIIIVAIGSMIGIFLFYTLVNLYSLFQVYKKPVVTQLNMPDDTTNQEEIPLKNVLTVFPIGESKVYFEAKDKNGTLKIDSKEFNELVENQEKNIGKPKFTVVIKATENAKYKDMVDLLDKLAYLKIRRYSINQITETENARINALP
jgi:biopolymer transport protein ExbD